MRQKGYGAMGAEKRVSEANVKGCYVQRIQTSQREIIDTVEIRVSSSNAKEGNGTTFFGVSA